MKVNNKRTLMIIDFTDEEAEFLENVFRRAIKLDKILGDKMNVISPPAW